ncbi:MAG: redoxin domain-containing protein [Planctomycetales bacterium]|nr:redoxin domain-containing protein [Planctomycetales bacterium]
MSNALARTSIVAVATSLILAVLNPANGTAQEAPPEPQPVLLQMIRDDAIHDELKLSDDQVRRVFESIAEIDDPWYQAGRLPTAERIATIEKLSAQLTNALSAILNQSQLERLDQLCNQALGTRMILRNVTAEKLGMTAQEREELYNVYRETDRQAESLKAKVKNGDLKQSEAMEIVGRAQNAERKKFADTLSIEQKRKLSTLTGQPFDFAKVKRRFPRAPEIVTEGSRWLQGDPVKLEDLRGKVVALHFYAFGCINCKRNLPHYNAWYDDFADDGLVVIGIQSPETAAERDPSKVAAAIKKDGMQYPVLFDGEKANWNKWAISWWPTVVLIDKQGFLRSHWEGEMNWQGTEGEKQMRQTIEQLLAER